VSETLSKNNLNDQGIRRFHLKLLHQTVNQPVKTVFDAKLLNLMEVN